VTASNTVTAATGNLTTVNATTLNGTTGNIATVNATNANFSGNLSVTGQTTLGNVSATNGNIGTVNATTVTATTGNIRTVNANTAAVSGNLSAGNTTVGTLTTSGNVAIAGNVTASGKVDASTVVASTVGVKNGDSTVNVLNFNNGAVEMSNVNMTALVDVANAKVNSAVTTPNSVGAVASDVKTLNQSNASNAFLDFFRKLFGSN
jgi:hypothetical protein